MVILVLGASGFIGSRLAAALSAAGHVVISGVRDPARFPRHTAVAIDYRRDHDPQRWMTRLAGVQVVINAVGILRETRDVTFEDLHVRAPAALFEACVAAGVSQVVQISALGADEGAASAYHRTKRAADILLAAQPLNWTILQPSLVYGAGGASARLFESLAVLPVIPVPGQGNQPVQPVHIDDVIAAVIAVIETPRGYRQCIPVVGPRPYALRDYLQALRLGMGLHRAPVLGVPLLFVRAVATIASVIPQLPWDRAALDMLQRGNQASAVKITRLLQREPRTVASFIPVRESARVRLQAQLRMWLPVLRFTVALLWIVTGVLSLGIYPVASSYDLLARVGLHGAAAAVALYGAALLDIALGAAVYAHRFRRMVWRVQIVVMAGYTALISGFLPEYWLHPYGPILKNLPLLGVLIFLHEMDDADRNQEGRKEGDR